MRKHLSKILCLLMAVISLITVLPLSASAATCSHTYIKVYTAENANMHSYVSKCTKCGTVTTGWGYSGWLDHTFNSAGRCTACGYTKECMHGSTKTVYAYENSNMHSYYAVCNSCGKKLEGYGYSGWSDHTYSGNTCSKCGYTKTCSHTNTRRSYTNYSTTQHKTTTVCNSCGISFNTIAESHIWNYGSWTSVSDTQHRRTNTCVCGASKTETASHTFSGNICTGCGYRKTETPAVTASVSLSASSPTGTLGPAGGEIAAESYPASYTVTASASGCSVTRIVYVMSGKSYTSYGSSVTITANDESEFQTATYTAYTSVSGVTATFTVNHKVVKKGKAYIMWETSHDATIRSITGNGLNKSLSHTMTIPNSYDSQTNLTADQVAAIQSLIGRSDGKTYMVNYTRTIWVYTPAEYSSTGRRIEQGTFDGNNSSDIQTCINTWGWSADTKEAIRQAASSSLSFTTGLPIDCTAVWVDSSTNRQLYSKKFGSDSITSSQSTVVSVAYSEYGNSGNYVYESLSYSGDYTGTSTAQSYSQTYKATSKPLTVTFYCHPKVSSGSITVRAVDGDTNVLISTATVMCGSKAGSSNPSTFTALSFGTYSVSASAPGYSSASGMATISQAAPSQTVTLKLYKQSGSVTVTVRDSQTRTVIPGAGVSGAGRSGSTDNYGSISFSGISYGTYTFTASASGYYSNSATATISKTTSSTAITIYLDPIQQIQSTTGSITVTVRDSSTNNIISGASVSGAGKYGTTNSSGYVYWSSIAYGTYTFTASASGYNSGLASAVISQYSPNASITIYLDPISSSGNITVTVRDSNTNSVISGASVSGASRIGNTGTYGTVTFSGVPYGSYTFTASATGYYSGSATASISQYNQSTNITIYLDPMPVNGSITITVRDSETNNVISEASVSGASRSGSTGTGGTVTFTGVSYGSYTFTAAKSGYYSTSSTVSITQSNSNATLTIYLDPLPTKGSITVTVRDSKTNNIISGASVSNGSISKSTNTNGIVYFTDQSFGSYTMTASASGYSSNTGSANISSSSTAANITILLTPQPTSGDITVYVRDKTTGTMIYGATVASGGYSGTTKIGGYIKFSGIPFNSYTFTANKSGYVQGSGTAAISVSDTSQSVTIYLDKVSADVSVTAREINGVIYRGSTIIVAADVKNGSTVNFTPDNPLTVTLTAKRNGGTVFSTQSSAVICPKNDQNLVWFKIDIPSDGYTNGMLTFTFTVATPADVTDNNTANNTSSKTATAEILPERSTPDASFELDVPNSFSNTVYKTQNNTSLSWSVWEWSNGFVRKTYSAKYSVTTSLTPDSTAVWKQYSDSAKFWTTRSGYGLNTNVSVKVTGLPGSMLAGSAKVNAYYPEFNYITAASSSDMLSRSSESTTSGYSAGFSFKSDINSISGGKMHKTPVWFPDGEYSVRYYIYDIWTPAGMLTGNNYSLINIEGSMYDDYYTQRD